MKLCQKISSDDGQGNVCNDEVPGVGFARDGDFHRAGTISLDRGAVRGSEADIGAAGDGGRVVLGQERTAGSGVDEVLGIRTGIFQEKHVGGACGICSSDGWLSCFMELLPVAGFFTLSGFVVESGVIKTEPGIT